MITLRNVMKAFGPQTLFEGATLQINEGDRFALVGPNGSGKSTLFRLILGEEAPDGGEISLRRGVRIGYLPQETAVFSGRTVLEEALGEPAAENRREAQAKKILMGLGFRIPDFNRSVMELSGGWRMRVAIARLLVDGPDLLMLDEPTNHLDLESLLWFQNYLQDYRGAIVLISHDREFINVIADRIVDLRERRLRVYTGSFEEFQEQRRLEEENLRAAWERQQKEIEEAEIFIRRFRAKASTASRAQAKIKQLEKMERIELPENLKTVGFSFPQPARSGQVALTLKGIRQSYDGQRWIYDGLDLTLERGQRVVLVGPNGAGKSTLLKLLAGQIPFQEGERKEGYATEVGYFSQHRAEMFQEGRTVLEEACATKRPLSTEAIRTVLGSFLFRGDAVFKKVEVLSGGEKSRLGLARLLLDPPNLLLMDEPTTHLDMASVDVLIQALERFTGTLCFISHDVYFIRRLANQVCHVNGGRVSWYPGDYDYFLHKKSLEEGEEAELFRSEERIESAHHHRPAPAPTPASAPKGPDVPGPTRKSKEQKRLEAEERQTRYRLQQEEKRKAEVLSRLREAEGLILNEMSRPETYQDGARVQELTRRLGELQKQIKGLTGS